MNGGSNMSNKYWDKEQLYAAVSRSTTSEYRISLCQKGDKQYVHIREWYCTKSDPTWKPSKQGMSLPISDEGAQIANHLENAVQHLYQGGEIIEEGEREGA
jgi:hypothetical protein